MGVCFSWSREEEDQQNPSSAYVVSARGELHQYTVPVKASQVLQSESSTSDAAARYFICNSDRLSFEEYIPSLEAEEELECGQIYFVLPETKLRQRLAASEMAALAVKASVALEQVTRGRKKRKVSRISPENSVDQRHNHRVNSIVVTHSSNIGDYDSTTTLDGNIKGKSSLRRSNTVRSKLTRYSSRRAKLAVRSFKIRLSTIYEGSVLYYT